MLDDYVTESVSKMTILAYSLCTSDTGLIVNILKSHLSVFCLLLKAGVHDRHLSVCVSVRLCVRVSAPKGINNQ